MRRAAIANMRPSWPLPSTPMVEPGRTGRINGDAPRAISFESVFPDAPRLRLPKATKGFAHRRIAEGEDLRREDRRVDRTGLADREGRDRHAARHLDDREEGAE